MGPYIFTHMFLIAKKRIFNLETIDIIPFNLIILQVQNFLLRKMLLNIHIIVDEFWYFDILIKCATIFSFELY